MLLNCGVGEDSWQSLALQGDQAILKEINLEYSLQGLMLKLQLQYFGHLMQRTDSLEKTLMLGKTEGGRRRGWEDWMASPMRWTWVWVNSGSWWWTGKPGVLQSMGSQRVGHNWATELILTERHGRERGTYICQSSKRTEKMEEKKFLQSDHDLGYD